LDHPPLLAKNSPPKPPPHSDPVLPTFHPPPSPPPTNPIFPSEDAITVSASPYTLFFTLVSLGFAPFQRFRQPKSSMSPPLVYPPSSQILVSKIHTPGTVFRFTFASPPYLSPFMAVSFCIQKSNPLCPHQKHPPLTVLWRTPPQSCSCPPPFMDFLTACLFGPYPPGVNCVCPRRSVTLFFRADTVSGNKRFGLL